MKTTKNTFRTPLYGSIYCEEAFLANDGRKDLDSTQMAELVDRYGQLHEFLMREREDLTYAVPEELSGCILRAEFGDYEVFDGGMHLLTHIWTEQALTEEEIEKVQEWITGQMSDGWGEGLEQREWYEERLSNPILYFNDDTLEFEEDAEICYAQYYVNPWNSEEFTISLCYTNEDDLEVDAEVVGCINLPGIDKTIYRVPNTLAFRSFIQSHACEELNSYLDPRILADLPHYFVEEETEDTVRVLPRYVVQTGPFAGIFRCRGESQPAPQSVSLDVAILALLK